MATISAHPTSPSLRPNFSFPDPPPSSPPSNSPSQVPLTASQHSDKDNHLFSDTRTSIASSNSLSSISLPPPLILPPIRTSLTQNPNPNPSPNSQPSSLRHLSFNQDAGCFTVGCDGGFRVYGCDPYREMFRREFDSGGGIGQVEMLFRANVLLLLGGGPDPLYPVNKVMIWDDNTGCCIGELSFRSRVRRVRLRNHRIVVVLEQKIYVYIMESLKVVHQIETIVNPKGLCEVSHTPELVLVCPGLQKGQIRVEHFASKKTKFIMAHDSSLACLALTHDGGLVATASSKGTLVRVFNTHDGTLLQEVRRGADRAEVYSLAFSSTAQWLAVSSDKGTVHVFSIKVNSGSLAIAPPENNDAIAPASYSLSFIKGVLPRYFSSEWSLAQFHLVEGTHFIAAFGHQKHTVIILGMDGSFYRCQFDPLKGGEMTQLEYHNFLKPEEPF